MSKEATKPEMVVASPAVTKLAKRLADVKAQKKALEAEEEKLKSQLLAKAANGPGIEGKDFVITTAASTSVSWKSIAEEVGFPKSLLAKHTKTGDLHIVCSGVLFKGEKAPAAKAA